jgi:thiamine kinase-like enzyme
VYLLEQAIAGWKNWNISLSEKPEVERELLGGSTNRSFLAVSGLNKIVIRVNNQNNENLGFDRQREIKILALIESLNISPKIYFADNNVLVSDFIEGYQWTNKDFAIPSNKQKVFSVIDKIKNVKVPFFLERQKYSKYCQNYIKQLVATSNPRKNKFYDELMAVAVTLDSKVWSPVINHQDIVPGNLIEKDNQIFLIDWEYSAFGHPDIDLVRLYGLDYESEFTKDLLFLQQGIDKLWGILRG